LLGFHGGYGTRARGVGLILCGREFGLSVREPGGQIIGSPAHLFSLSAISSERLLGAFSASLGRSRAAIRLLKLLAQGGRRFGGTFLRSW
jgi:hypothetical protein